MILGKMKIPLLGGPLLTNLLSCWELDETSGTTVYDAKGSKNGTSYNASINQTGFLGPTWIQRI